MALDIHAFSAVETATSFLAFPAATVGADYSATVPGSTGTNDAGGLILIVTGALAASSFDAIVQTAVENAPPGLVPDLWVDTNSRINGIAALGQYQLHITDPIISKCRLRIVRTAGAATPTWSTTWLSDRAVQLN